jgi:hypothetical protein
VEGGIRIVRIDLGAGPVYPHDERGVALGDLIFFVSGWLTKRKYICYIAIFNASTDDFP